MPPGWSQAGLTPGEDPRESTGGDVDTKWCILQVYRRGQE